MITKGRVNNEFAGVIVYRGHMNINGPDLTAAVKELVGRFPKATVVGIVGNLESGNEIEFQTVT